MDHLAALILMPNFRRNVAIGESNRTIFLTWNSTEIIIKRRAETVHTYSGLPDFSCDNIPKRGKIIKITKWP
jgi:hypothetical protein